MSYQDMFDLVDDLWDLPIHHEEEEYNNLVDFEKELKLMLPRSAGHYWNDPGIFTEPVASGVGDDRVVSSQNIIIPLAEWMFLEKDIGLILSHSDEAIHPHVFNYASETRNAPISRVSDINDALSARKEPVPSNFDPMTVKNSNPTKKGGVGLSKDDPKLYHKAPAVDTRSLFRDDPTFEAKNLQLALLPAMVTGGKGPRAVLASSEGGAGMAPPFGVSKTLYNLMHKSSPLCSDLMEEAILAHSTNGKGDFPAHETLYNSGLNAINNKKMIPFEEFEQFRVHYSDFDDEQMTMLGIALEKGQLIDQKDVAVIYAAQQKVEALTSAQPLSKPEMSSIEYNHAPEYESARPFPAWTEGGKNLFEEYERLNQDMKRIPIAVLAKANIYQADILTGLSPHFHVQKGVEVIENVCTQKRNRIKEAIKTSFRSSERIVPYDLKPLAYLRSLDKKENVVIVSADGRLLSKGVAMGGIGFHTSTYFTLEDTRAGSYQTQINFWSPGGRTRNLNTHECQKLGIDLNLPTKIFYDTYNIEKGHAFLEDVNETEELFILNQNNTGRIWDRNSLFVPIDEIRIGRFKPHRATHYKVEKDILYRYRSTLGDDDVEDSLDYG